MNERHLIVVYTARKGIRASFRKRKVGGAYEVNLRPSLGMNQVSYQKR